MSQISSKLPDQKLRIGIDYDSTVWPTYEVWQRISGNPLFAADNIYSWEDAITYAGGPEAFKELDQQASTYEAMANHQPFANALPTLVELQELGAHQTLITARHEANLAATVRILNDHGYQPAVVVSRKGADKATYCLEHDISLLLEDEPGTIRSAHEAGVQVASLRYPYNAAMIDELGIPHAANWAELRPIIFELLGLPH